MTHKDDHQEPTPVVDEVLLDAGLSGASDLRQALQSFEALGSLPAPEPGPALLAMVNGPHDEVSKRRWRRKHRTAVIGVAVVAAMGLGVSGVAASGSGPNHNHSFIHQIFTMAVPHTPAAASALPVPGAPKASTSPAQRSGPASVPSAQALAAVGPASDTAAQAAAVPGQSAASQPTTPQPQPNPAQPQPPAAQAPAPAQTQDMLPSPAQGSAPAPQATPPQIPLRAPQQPAAPNSGKGGSGQAGSGQAGSGQADSGQARSRQPSQGNAKAPKAKPGNSAGPASSDAKKPAARIATIAPPAVNDGARQQGKDSGKVPQPDKRPRQGK
ncbi:hypothetical protein [Paenarthrobacter ilicis]|uniref:hypothetical protein n=1 Tax=Paenarthrobacter ilicis TaxID=43665 RepID=UPI0028D6ACB4|nr:hypothetical protein [Paenarthrobacter ilicis]